MSAIDEFRRGDLDAALGQLLDEVRNAPDQPKHRVFLFQMLAIQGQWDRALTQLNVARDLDPDAMLMAQTYQEVLRCEALRQQVFEGKRAPLLFGEPPAWIANAIEAQKHAAAGEFAAAKSLREEAWEAAPTQAGIATLSKGSAPAESNDEGEPCEQVEFEWLADADTRLGPILEAVVDGRYYWIPFERIQSIELERPADLRDFVWMPARFVWSNEGQTVGMIPTRYPGSEAHADSEIRLARRTEWQEPGDDAWHGVGERTFATDETEFGLLSLRKLEFSAPG